MTWSSGTIPLYNWMKQAVAEMEKHNVFTYYWSQLLMCKYLKVSDKVWGFPGL